MKEETVVFEDELDADEESSVVTEYDITTSPRDLTPGSVIDMVNSGIINIPFFQRNYVWDIKKASKLIESLILGLPIPELFFYSEGDENTSYKIIDGQQRLLSIYFYLQGRFPKNNQARIMIGKALNEGSEIERTLADNHFFQDFCLQLNNEKDGIKSKYNSLKYSNLDKETQVKLRLRRYLRTVVVRQNKPDNNNQSMFEIFNRLNTGGTALNNQEIRASLYYCPFYEMLSRINDNPLWRNILGNPVNDLHCADTELILRVIALLVEGDKYAPKMVSFLNCFSQTSKTFSPEKIKYLEELFVSFLKACSKLGEKAFFRNNRFSKPFFESVFLATCEESFNANQCVSKLICKDSFEELKTDLVFASFMQAGSSSKESIVSRKARAIELLHFEEE